jgi:hypothetical protein
MKIVARSVGVRRPAMPVWSGKSNIVIPFQMTTTGDSLRFMTAGQI